MDNTELDRLIHEKVMGLPLDVQCEQEDHLLVEGTYWICCTCGWKSDDLEHTEHYQKIPAYSTDLNEAWKIFKHFTLFLESELWLQNLMRQQLLRGLGITSGKELDVAWFSLLLTPEKICKAALNVYGVEVE